MKYKITIPYHTCLLQIPDILPIFMTNIYKLNELLYMKWEDVVFSHYSKHRLCRLQPEESSWHEINKKRENKTLWEDNINSFHQFAPQPSKTFNCYMAIYVLYTLYTIEKINKNNNFVINTSVYSVKCYYWHFILNE